MLSSYSGKGLSVSNDERRATIAVNDQVAEALINVLDQLPLTSFLVPAMVLHARANKLDFLAGNVTLAVG